MNAELETRLSPPTRMKLCGGATAGLFPEAERLLLSDTEAEAGILLALKPSPAELKTHASLMDLMFRAIFTGYARAFRDYHAGQQGALRDRPALNSQQVYHERVMCEAIRFAKTLKERKKSLSRNIFISVLKNAVDRQMRIEALSKA